VVVAPFTPDIARRLPGPAWLADRRGVAAERVEASPWPTAEEEIWHYSRIDELDLASFAAGDGLSTEIHGGDGLVVGLGEGRELLEIDLLRSPDLFADLNEAFAPEPVIIAVAPGKVIPEPVIITHRVSGSGTWAFPRLVVDAGTDSEVTVVERFVSDAGTEAFVAPVLELRARPASRVRYLAVNQLGPQVWQIANQAVVGERDSNTLTASVALGGGYARVRSDNSLVGQGASAQQIALYFGEADQMHDFRTLQVHEAPRTTSDLLFKGAVEGRSRSVYTGLIQIGHDARGANAFQTNRNLKLSDEAWAESVPNLDIKTNDVRCSHASTVGPIDEEQRFYLESRGVPPNVAERLIVLGFFDEVLERLPAPSLVPGLRAEIMAKLDRRDRS